MENLDLETLNRTQLQEINGGGVVLGAIAAAAGVYWLAMNVAEAEGYDDGKAACN